MYIIIKNYISKDTCDRCCKIYTSAEEDYIESVHQTMY